MTKVTRGASVRTLFHLQEEVMCRRAAAYVLALSADGIPVLTHSQAVELFFEDGHLTEREKT